MSLGTRLTLKTAVLVLAVVVVAGAALLGLGALNRDLDAALGQYDRLRKAYMLIRDVEQARDAARSTVPTPDRVRQPIQRAVLMLDEQAGVFTDEMTAEVRRELMLAFESLEDAEPGQPISYETVSPLYTVINKLTNEISDTAAGIEAIEQRSARHRTKVLVAVGITAALAAALAIAVGVWQYLAVMNPLRRLQRGVERLASGDFADQLRATGDREFVQLANDFNRMADDLATLYRELEDKVRLRSAQLAQSERLASVGFLAAGVAHEINNPLAIIAGEAELALGALTDDVDQASRQSLQVIRDEAFRCKTITQKLVSLARPGSETRAAAGLRQLAEEVASLIKTLPQHKDRQVVVEGQPVQANTDSARVKQVLLNLAINALEAVPAGTGRVRLIVGQSLDGSTIAVQDNGKGIDADALSRVFEPFYTAKKNPNTPGLGLGLSISHAIIEDLGGQLTAASPGPGQGSTFTIELPKAK
ncbi:MAG: HAMP domain-containing histidine kinase [Phycisphaeraceae bacterium]|nr:HAMP domain-containing histidine kinase [Phycisphaeraceae bacterium]